jgi:hypothetical protein
MDPIIPVLAQLVIERHDYYNGQKCGLHSTRGSSRVAMGDTAVLYVSAARALPKNGP